MKIYTKTGDKGTTGLYDGSRTTKTSIFFDVLGENDELSSRIGMLHAIMKKNYSTDPKNPLAVLAHFEKQHQDDKYPPKLSHFAMKKLSRCRQAKQYLELLSFIRMIQANLQDINTIVATANRRSVPPFSNDNVMNLERWIDKLEGDILLKKDQTKLMRFILPGVTVVDAQAHLCRTQARKTERQLCKFHSSTETMETSRGLLVERLELVTICVSPAILQYMNRLSDFFFVLARWLCHCVFAEVDVCK